ncbi:hypothetical protein VPNG_09375 [Cytospora leucostoma]|uniref:Uncharacterized protein n=1 Tax=Cytospora leucostoma TaxID=1230097 RepID=A0A423VTL5_9PEZI|nr:hypothetical protein VPNG_09375 [Cytospora leucostoma]
MASMAQQLHTYIWWTSNTLEQFNNLRMNIGNPELSVAGPSVGVDLVLFYIQWYCYNVESILVISWAAGLAYSVYCFNTSVQATCSTTYAAKITAILLPILQVGLMRASFVQSSSVGFYFLANVIMAVSLVLSLAFLLAILAKYLSTRPDLSWHVRYGDRSAVAPAGPAASEDDLVGSQASSTGSPSNGRSIYDNWLIIRFTFAFVGLSAFQLLLIADEVGLSRSNKRTALKTDANLSPKHATADVLTFLPGVSPGLFAFVVFGTTRLFQEYFYRNLVSRGIGRWRRRPLKGPLTISILPPRIHPRFEAARPGSAGGDSLELGGGDSSLGIGDKYELDIRSPGL